jgi:hypothetical protein
MKYLAAIAGIGLFLAVTGTAGAMTLAFDANDIFNYATTDDTRLNQQGTARYIQTSGVTGRYYQTYNDGTRDIGATAAKDLQSVANILDWSATVGFQGVSHIQLWLSNATNAPKWGEKVVQVGYQNSLTASVNGEYDWTATIGENPWDADGNNPPYVPGEDQYGIVHYNTVLGGAGHQNALSLDFNPADDLWSVTGDFYVDNNANGVYDTGDTDLVLGDEYTLWFSAAFNNWHCVDAYGNDAWGSFLMEGTLSATAVPEPITMAGLVLGLGSLATYLRRRRMA